MTFFILGDGSKGLAQESEHSFDFTITESETVDQKDGAYHFQRELHNLDWFAEDHFHYLYYKGSEIEIGFKLDKDPNFLLSFYLPVLVFNDSLELTFIQSDVQKTTEEFKPEFGPLLSSFTSCEGSTGSETAMVNWSDGFCTICGVVDYSCNIPAPYFAGWNNGSQSYTDPVGAGRTLTQIQVIIYGAIACDFGLITARINGVIMGFVLDTDACYCGECDTKTITFTGEPVGYNYGGTNTLNLSALGTICVDRADIVLSYCDPCSLPCASFPFGVD